MLYTVRLVHRITGFQVDLSVEAPNDWTARQRAWGELARKGYPEPHRGAWYILAVSQVPV